MPVQDLRTYVEWLLPNFEGRQAGALLIALFLLACGSVLAMFIAYVVGAIRHGPIEGFMTMASGVAQAVPDMVLMAPRRLAAIARLAVKESLRARVLVVFVVFAIGLSLGGWFIDPGTDHPSRTYLKFVLPTTTYLVMTMALLMSTLSLPADIKSRTIYTVVTKPVRPSEVVLGRMLGYVLVGTVVVALMGVVSYVFVLRGLSHSHVIEAEPAEIEAALAADGVWRGHTSRDARHRHEIVITRGRDGTDEVVVDREHEHLHELVKDESGWRVGPPMDQLRARVPRYGSLSFLNRNGGEGRGISVGKEWTYRRYIEGDTLAAGVWLFKGIDERRFPDGLPVELTLSVYRTYKGDIKTAVKGSITLRNPDATAPVRESQPIAFYSREFETDQQVIPRTVQAVSATGETIPEADIFEDLCDEEGRIEVVVRCRDGNQYFGVSQADVYLVESDRSFLGNFIKGYLGVWMQMVLVICFGVMFSTFLSSPIAVIATLSIIVLGTFRDGIHEQFRGVYNSNAILVQMFGTVAGEGEGAPGGGPIESFIRMVTQKNLTMPLDMGWLAEGIIKSIDVVMMGMLEVLTYVAPNFAKFNTAEHVAYGYNISPGLLGQQVTTCATYVTSLSLVGYFLLKTREVGA